MWRSFGGSSGWGGAGARGGGGYGGDGSGGGWMFRTATRVSRAGLSNLDNSSPSSSSFSASSPKKSSKRGLSMSSKSADVCANSALLSNLGFGPAWPPLSSNSALSDESDRDWVCVRDEFETTEIDSDYSVSLDDCVFGSAPSAIEAETALISLQNTLQTSCHSASDWIKPGSHSAANEQIICPDISRVYDAFHLLQTEPSIQRMVISLSSDKAVWNAVLNNEAVQELKEAFHKDEVNAAETSGDEPPGNVLSWILEHMRAGFMEFLTGITDLMKEMLQPHPVDEVGNFRFPDGFGELVRSAFMLTAIVLLIVVVTRASHA